MPTINEFYNPSSSTNNQDSQKSENNKFIETLIDINKAVYDESFYGERKAELDVILTGINFFDSVSSEQDANAIALALANEFKTGFSKGVPIDVYTMSSDIVGLSTEGVISVFGEYDINRYNSEDLSNPKEGRLKKKTIMGRINDLKNLTLANPKFVAKLIRAEAKVKLGGEFNTNADLKEAIDSFNNERPGSDSMFDNGYREIRDRLEGRTGWLNT